MAKPPGVDSLEQGILALLRRSKEASVDPKPGPRGPRGQLGPKRRPVQRDEPSDPMASKAIARPP